MFIETSAKAGFNIKVDPKLQTCSSFKVVTNILIPERKIAIDYPKTGYVIHVVHNERGILVF